MTRKNQTLSMASFRVLNLLAAHPHVPMCGVDVIAELGMASGTVYPILAQFKTDGLFNLKWEKQTPEALGRPRRLLYKITSRGKHLAGSLIFDMGLQRIPL